MLHARSMGPTSGRSVEPPEAQFRRLATVNSRVSNLRIVASHRPTFRKHSMLAVREAHATATLSLTANCSRAVTNSADILKASGCTAYAVTMFEQRECPAELRGWRPEASPRPRNSKNQVGTSKCSKLSAPPLAGEPFLPPLAPNQDAQGCAVFFVDRKIS